jgi:hypothetical protein
MKKIIDSNLGMLSEAKGNQASYDSLVKEASKAQEAARTTVTDASDRLPAFKAVNGVNVRTPDKMVLSEADCAAISRGHVTDITSNR